MDMIYKILAYASCNVGEQYISQITSMSPPLPNA